jgi:hypothetical protein
MLLYVDDKLPRNRKEVFTFNTRILEGQVSIIYVTVKL